MSLSGRQEYLEQSLPAHDWAVEELARKMGASQSGFAERFTRAVGETPARYVARMRMRQTHQWLREG